MKSFFSRIPLLLVAVALLSPCTASALWETSDEGTWPASWPKELEPFRAHAHTYVSGTSVPEVIYEIRFTNRTDFDRVWPALLKLKTPEAPLTLYRTDSPSPKEYAWLLTNAASAVRVYASSGGRIDLDLVADGKVIDLDKLKLPPGTVTHDDRIKIPKRTASQGVRVRFVPDRKSKSGRGASFSSLNPSPARWGDTVAIVHAGIGDEFPIRDDHEGKFFDVTVIDGDDNHLVLEIRSKSGSQRIDLQRDKQADLVIAKNKFELYYPSLMVSTADKSTSDQAMIIVTRRP